MTTANILISVVLVLNIVGNPDRTFPHSVNPKLRVERIAEPSAMGAQSEQQPTTYRHSSPSFSCNIPSGWVEYSKTPTPGVYTKFWRVADGVFTGSGIRITGGPAGDVTAVWDINPNDLRTGFEKDYAVRNYRTAKVTINGRSALRFEFDSQLTENGKGIPIKIVGHTFFTKEPEGEYLVMALLLSRVFEITTDNAGYMSVVNSLRFN